MMINVRRQHLPKNTKSQYVTDLLRKKLTKLTEMMATYCSITSKKLLFENTIPLSRLNCMSY